MEKKYTLERSLLKRGDIILTGERTPVSKGIRIGTVSRYSHAAIWVGGTMIEAVRAGVFSKNAQRLMVDKASYCTVLRSRKPLSDLQLDQICRYARTQVGSLYALNEAILSLPRRLMRLESTKKQFCSRLVALAYAQVDYDFENLKSPHYCTPAKLSRITAFERVHGVVREATAGEIEFANSFDPAKKNAIDTFEWLAKVRAMVERTPELKAVFDIQTINDVSGFLMRRPEFDAEVVGFMHENDYLTFYDHDVSANPFRYNPTLMTMMVRSAPNKARFVDQEIKKEVDLIAHQTQNIFNGVHNYRQAGLSFTFEHLKLYRNIVIGARVRLNHIAIACESVGMRDDADRAHELLAEIARPLAVVESIIASAYTGSAA